MNVGIIGGGYVGKAVASKWKEKCYNVSITTRKLRRIEELKTMANQVFLLEEGQLERFLTLQEVVLLSVAPDTSSDYASTYLGMARAIAQNLSSHHKQIIYTGSVSVYGDQQGQWVDETTPVSPSNENIRLLCETENLLLNLASNQLKICILRLGEIYGPQREIKERLRRLQGQPFPGTGENYTNLIHLNDIVKAVDFALDHRLNGIYNLCNDCHIPRYELYETICQKEGLSPIQWNANIKSIHGGNKRVSNQKLKDLGFIFQLNN